MPFAYLSLAAAMILVGLNIPVGKMLLDHFPVFGFSVIRGLVGILILFPLLKMKYGRIPAPGLSGGGAILGQAFIGVFLFNLFILWGLERTSSIDAGIITSTIPAAVALLGFLFFRERLTMRALMIIALAVCGVMLVNLGGNAQGAAGDLIGNGFVIGAVFCEALFVIFAKRASGRLSPLAATAWLNLAALVMFLPLGLPELVAMDLVSVPADVWLLLFYYAVTSSVISYMLWFFGTAHVPVSQSGLFTAVLPVSAVCGGAFFLQETLSSMHVVGIGATIGAILLGTMANKKNA
ncbi:DMT family transporter [Aestuariispira insulae]|uniref:Threonine/homoserine efflux transporter RhtA n=1 Tax=Aestuariispira insulae TaxID=1461337 RepID=A0A3D9HF75_9PROT|nr:DMT family transporter [Aestuariispira insulae]RED48130.1 threonine/homoserine efflux transporter RhtA [Aestuariispira insulae]